MKKSFLKIALLTSVFWSFSNMVSAVVFIKGTLSVTDLGANTFNIKCNDDNAHCGIAYKGVTDTWYFTSDGNTWRLFGIYDPNNNPIEPVDNTEENPLTIGYMIGELE